MTIRTEQHPELTGRVLCVAGWWPKKGDVAGIFIREHVKAIARSRRVVVVYMEVVKGRSLWPTTKLSTDLEEGLSVHRITISTPVRRSGVPAWLARRAYYRVVRRLHREDPLELVHIHVRTEETEQCVPVATALDLPIVLTEHNSFYHLGIRALPKDEEATQRRRIRHWLANPRIAMVMPVSKDLSNILENDYGVARSRLTVIPNVAAHYFSLTTDRPSGPYRIMLASVWRPPKDHDVFIRALRELPTEIRGRIRVDWVGFGPDYALIQQRCKDELPDVDIRFPGYMDKARMARAMQEADLFVLPTKADNLPCVVLESLCCGTPVISMAVNGVPELIGPSNGILVPPSDPSALAEALLQCIGDRSRFDRQAISKAAVARYSESAVGDRIDEVYRALITAGSRSSGT